MISYCDVRVAFALSCIRHFQDGVYSVAGSGVHVKVTGDVLELDELWQLASCCGFDFPSSFAKLRLDVR